MSMAIPPPMPTTCSTHREVGGSGLQDGLVERLRDQGDRRPCTDRRLEQRQWLCLSDERPAARQPGELGAQEATAHTQVGMAGALEEVRVHDRQDSSPAMRAA